LAVVLAVAGAPAETALAAPAPIDPATEHDQCVTMALGSAPRAALDRARQWAKRGGGFPADHCAAIALYELKQYREAAQAFDKLAGAMAKESPSGRASVYDQGGQAWLVAENPRQAKSDFDAAMRLDANNPDLLIDRAEALAALHQYWDAIDDLNRASDLAPQEPEIYAYRAAAYRAVDSLDLAREDIARNLKLAPNNPVGLLERGNIRSIEGDTAGARQDWLLVAKIAPDSPSAAAANANLAQLSAVGSDASSAAPTQVPARK
jgi:tetratricopeptide (TPR) repeat protein